MGWIDANWADAHMSSTHENIVGSGVFYAVGAILTASDKTYYAVWAKEQ